MAVIKINVDKVRDAADKISTINNRMRDDYSIITDAINNLNKNWDGDASNSAIRTADSIKKSYYEPRYNTIQDLVVFLKTCIGDNYETTENQVKSIADKFK